MSCSAPPTASRSCDRFWRRLLRASRLEAPRAGPSVGSAAMVLGTEPDALDGPKPRTPKVVASGRGHDLTAIISAYPSLVTRAYCVARFRIIRGRFLEEIGQFLPWEAKGLEV